MATSQPQGPEHLDAEAHNVFPYKPANSKMKRNRNARTRRRFLRDLPALGLRPGIADVSASGLRLNGLEF